MAHIKYGAARIGLQGKAPAAIARACVSLGSSRALLPRLAVGLLPAGVVPQSIGLAGASRLEGRVRAEGSNSAPSSPWAGAGRLRASRADAASARTTDALRRPLHHTDVLARPNALLRKRGLVVLEPGHHGSELVPGAFTGQPLVRPTRGYQSSCPHGAIRASR